MGEDEPSNEIAELIERHLDAVAQGMPPPDLSASDLHEAGKARKIIDVIDTLVNSGPAEVPLAHDPVAIRLGLVPQPQGSPIDRPDDPIVVAVRDAERRYSFVAQPASTDGTEFSRRFECSSMVEHVLVVATPEPTDFVVNAAHARSAFAHSDELSAVAYCSADADMSSVLTYGDCHDKVVPGAGWQSSWPDFGSEPLAVALGRYFEQSDPRWEAVQTLGGLDTWDDLAGDVAAVVAMTLQRVTDSKPQLIHKQAARAFVASQSEEILRGWVTRVQQGDAGGEDITNEIRELVWGVSE